uniref:Uncharacterized protein n=1 Tax=Oryza rufipogon TaxID=4529 RepID=A0A0E0P340_ORYRU
MHRLNLGLMRPAVIPHLLDHGILPHEEDEVEDAEEFEEVFTVEDLIAEDDIFEEIVAEGFKADMDREASTVAVEYQDVSSLPKPGMLFKGCPPYNSIRNTSKAKIRMRPDSNSTPTGPPSSSELSLNQDQIRRKRIDAMLGKARHCSQEEQQESSMRIATRLHQVAAARRAVAPSPHEHVSLSRTKPTAHRPPPAMPYRSPHLTYTHPPA